MISGHAASALPTRGSVRPLRSAPRRPPKGEKRSGTRHRQSCRQCGARAARTATVADDLVVGDGLPQMGEAAASSADLVIAALRARARHPARQEVRRRAGSGSGSRLLPGPAVAGAPDITSDRPVQQVRNSARGTGQAPRFRAQPDRKASAGGADEPETAGAGRSQVDAGLAVHGQDEVHAPDVDTRGVDSTASLQVWSQSCQSSPEEAVTQRSEAGRCPARDSGAQRLDRSGSQHRDDQGSCNGSLRSWREAAARAGQGPFDLDTCSSRRRPEYRAQPRAAWICNGGNSL